MSSASPQNHLHPLSLPSALSLPLSVDPTFTASPHAPNHVLLSVRTITKINQFPPHLNASKSPRLNSTLPIVFKMYAAEFVLIIRGLFLSYLNQNIIPSLCENTNIFFLSRNMGILLTKNNFSPVRLSSALSRDFEAACPISCKRPLNVQA